MFPQNEVEVWDSAVRVRGVGARKWYKEEPNLVSAMLVESEPAASVFHLFGNSSAQFKPRAESNLTVKHTPLAQYCRLIKVCSSCSDKFFYCTWIYFTSTSFYSSNQTYL